MSDTKRSAKLVKFGRGGDTVEYGGGCVGTGYGTPERPHAADVAKGEIPDGCPVLDVREAVETPAGLSWVFCGPMVNPDMPDGEVDRMGEVSPIMAAAMAENEYGGLLAVHEAIKAIEPAVRAGALDKVSVAEYVRGWREHGARVGEYRGGVIVWE